MLDNAFVLIEGTRNCKCKSSARKFKTHLAAGRAEAEADAIAEGAEEADEAGDDAFAAGLGGHGLNGSKQEIDDGGGRDARGGAVNGLEADAAIAINDENGRLGDAALFGFVEDAPFADDAALRIAEDREGQAQLPADTIGKPRRIHGDGDQISAGLANLRVEVAILRQLAEAEGSPETTIEKQDAGAGGDEAGEAARRSRGIRELEFGGEFADLGRRRHWGRRDGTRGLEQVLLHSS